MSHSSGDEVHRKRRRSHKTDEGPARQRRKVDTGVPTNDDTAATIGVQGASPSQHGGNSLAVKSLDHGRRKRKHKRKSGASIATPVRQTSLTSGPGTWQFGSRNGGRYLCQDPIFSPDGQTMYAATRAGVRVLSMRDSLVEHTFECPSKGSVTAFALSKDAGRLYVSHTGSARISQWDTTSLESELVDSSFELDGVASMVVTYSDELQKELLWAVQCTSGGSQVSCNGSTVFDAGGATISNFYAEGSIFVASMETTILVGTVSHSADNGIKSSVNRYETTSKITCLTVRQVVIAAGQKKSQKIKKTLDIAAGKEDGEILLYSGITISGSGTLPTPQSLHWHSQAVGSVKWSKDGNYLISGGQETVLVIWQLVTGKKQFLPHLSAEVERITISPDGTAYAVQLADNSIMVLSTSELVPIANFAGFQAALRLPTTAPEDKQIIHSTPSAWSSQFANVSTLHPRRKNEILVAVPSSTLTTSNDPDISRSRPFLQTFDIDNDHHISRQALTRNKVTDFTTGPEGNTIQEPNIVHMQISHDGEWLATVEEWLPPKRDTAFLVANESVNDEHVKSRAEIYLKFWHWQPTKNTWALDTRIVNPHPSSLDDRPGRVLSLSSDPSDSSFATIGEDSCVRVWRPQSRRRNGIIAKGDFTTEWKARFVIALEQACDPDEPVELFASTAYSSDGSLLAVSIAPEYTSGPTNPSPINFIQIPTGELLAPQCGIYTGSLVDMSFLDRNLIILSTQSISVWDVVNASLTHRTRLDDSPRIMNNDHSGAASLRRPRILCTNRSESRFAVAIPVDPTSSGKSSRTDQTPTTIGSGSGSGSGSVHATRVLVYSPHSPFQKLFDETIEDVVTAILARESDGTESDTGFVLLFASAGIVALKPQLSITSTATLHGDALGPKGLTFDASELETNDIEDAEDAEDVMDITEQEQTGLEQEEFLVGDAGIPHDDGFETLLRPEDEQGRLVRAEQLAKILDQPDALNMPVSAMFDAVVGLFARKVVV